MSTLAVPTSPRPIIYPDSDGKPMAEDGLRLVGPDDQPFGTFEEMTLVEESARRQAEEQRRRAEEAEKRAEQLQAELDRLRREAKL